MEALSFSIVGPFGSPRHIFSDWEDRLRNGKTTVMDHSDLEDMINAEGREILRLMLQAHLDRRAMMEASGPVTAADGSARPHHREGQRPLETIFGTVMVSRSGHGEQTLFPLDASLNLPEDRWYSFGVHRRAAEEAARGSPRRGRRGDRQDDRREAGRYQARPRPRRR